MNETDPIEWVIVILLVLSVVLHLVALLILNSASRRGEKISALEERKVAANWWLAASAAVAFVVVNVVIGRPVNLEPPWSQLVIGFGLLAGGVPAGLFILRWVTGGFRDQ